MGESSAARSCGLPDELNTFFRYTGRPNMQYIGRGFWVDLLC